MEAKFNLTQLKSCKQVWEEMQPCEGGRFCVSCKNVIHDLRGLSELEIAYLHSNSQGKLCGIYDSKRFHPDTTRTRYTHRKLWAAGIWGWLSAMPGQVPALPTAPSTFIFDTVAAIDTHSTSRQEKNIIGDAMSDSLKIVKGIVKDEAGIRVIGASVFVGHTQKGCISDTDGRYLLDITDELEQLDSVKLIFHYMGYQQEQRSIRRSDFASGHEIELNVDFKEFMHVTDFYVLARKPGLWYKLRRLFRKGR